MEFFGAGNDIFFNWSLKLVCTIIKINSSSDWCDSVGHCPTKWKAAGLTAGQGTCPDCGPGAGWGAYKR